MIRIEKKIAGFLLLFLFIFLVSNMEISGIPGGPGDGNMEYDCSSSCHNEKSGAQKSSGTITMSTNNSNPEAGTPIFVNVTVSNTEQEAGEPISVFLVTVLDFSVSQPSEKGWEIVSDPHGGEHNSIQEAADGTGSVTLSWILNAPSTPGTFKLYAREHHGDGTNKPFYNDFTDGLTFDVFSLIKIKSTTLEIEYPTLVFQDEATTITVTLIDEENNFVENAFVEVYTPTLFGLLKIGANNTDSNGQMTVHHEFKYSGEIEIIAKFKGGIEFNASEASAKFNVQSTYEPEKFNFNNLGQVCVIGTVLGGIWSVFGFIFYMLYRIHNSLKGVNEYFEPDDSKEGNT